MTDQQLAELQQRNRNRVEAAKQALGTRYVLHPSHSVVRGASPASLAAAGPTVLRRPMTKGGAL